MSSKSVANCPLAGEKTEILKDLPKGSKVVSNVMGLPVSATFTKRSSLCKIFNLTADVAQR